MRLTLLKLGRCVCALMATLLSGIMHAAPGDLYVTDSGNDTLFRYTPAGTSTPFASGQSVHLAGLAFDSTGNLYVAASDSGLIFKFTPAGTRTTFASGLSAPFGLAFDGLGNLYVTDFNAIFKITVAGVRSTFALAPTSLGSLAFDSSGNLFATESLGDKIFKFAPDGTRTTFASGLSHPAGLAFDKSGNLFVATSVAPGGTPFSTGTVFKFNHTGTRSTFTSDLRIAGDIAFDSAGNLFVADPERRTIEKFTPAAVKSTFASVFLPTGLAFEPMTDRLRNTSARGLVQTGDNVLIGGFIVGGSALNNAAVLIRAIGPSLSQFGVVNPLQDPTLVLYNSSGAVIASNNNWQDTQSSQISATGISPSDPRESAIFATLPAGSFTVITRGANNSRGVALLEIYSLNK
jgi:sugar lactone lactonase YvrE